MYLSVYCYLAEELDFATCVVLICLYCKDGHSIRIETYVICDIYS
jgi:hypothetical protein